MISYMAFSEILEHDVAKDLGISENVFMSLPIEYQKALINGCFEREIKRNRLDNFKKRLALKQYNFEENLKDKVLSMIKKK